MRFMKSVVSFMIFDRWHSMIWDLIPTLKKYLSTIGEYEKDVEIHFQN